SWATSRRGQHGHALSSRGRLVLDSSGQHYCCASTLSTDSRALGTIGGCPGHRGYAPNWRAVGRRSVRRTQTNGLRIAMCANLIVFIAPHSVGTHHQPELSTLRCPPLQVIAR